MPGYYPQSGPSTHTKWAMKYTIITLIISVVFAFDIDPNLVQGSYLLAWSELDKTFSLAIGT